MGIKLNENKIKDIKKLHKMKGVRKEKAFLVEGYHLVEEAINHGKVVEIISCKEEYFKGIRTTFVDENTISRISQLKTPQGIVAICKLIPNATPNSMKKVVVLDNVQDPGNVGTIIRTAISFGWDQIVILNGTASIYNIKTIMSSQGSIFKASISNMTTEEWISNCHKWEFITTVLNESAIKLSEHKKQTAKQFAICLGNEGSGVNQKLIEKSYPLYIEINKMESLNVAIAAGIFLYNLK